MTKRRLKAKVIEPKYKVVIHRKHPSDIGSIGVKEIMIHDKPTYDNCDFFDVTNGEFCRWE